MKIEEKYLNYIAYGVIMYKRVVGEYVEDELKKGKTIDQIRMRLIKVGYRERDVDNVLRTFELRESDLANKGERLAVQRTRVYVLFAIIFLVTVVNAAFFFYYFSEPDYILVRETPTGLVTVDVTKEEFRNLQESLNVSNGSGEGLGEIS